MAKDERVHKATVVQVGRIHASMRVTTRASHTRDTHAEIHVGSCTCIIVYGRVARSWHITMYQRVTVVGGTGTFTDLRTRNVTRNTRERVLYMLELVYAYVASSQIVYATYAYSVVTQYGTAYMLRDEREHTRK